VARLRGRGVKLGIFSRNSLAAIERALANFSRTRLGDFDVVLAREHVSAPKPQPEAVLVAARRLGLAPGRLLVVGDFVFDIQAGRAAGAPTALLTNGAAPAALEPPPDFVLDRLAEVDALVRLRSPLAVGKLSNDLLARFLGELGGATGPARVGPGVGEDCAAVDLAGEEVLVLKSDPVTFAADAIGRYAVTVSVNDVATSGARPRWLLATLLFPPGATGEEVRAVMGEIAALARAHGVVLAGGHTEVTDAVRRPVVVAAVAGTVARGGLVEKRNLAEGDRIWLTQAVAIEGTAILARDFGPRLAALGVGAAELERARALLDAPGIGIARAAAAAAGVAGVHALHDVTEGGLATALEELALAGGHRLRVWVDRIPILPETRSLCAPLGLDPLGLIGSGSLLVACAPEGSTALEAALGAAGVPVRAIGEALGTGAGVEAVAAPGGPPRPWPRFEVDELARLYARLGSEAPGSP
jgi:hydrogenase maturation factor